MLYLLQRKLNYLLFNFVNRAALSTPPLRLAPSGPIVITQLCHNDLVMYLIAIKTFSERIPPSAVYVLDDGTLTTDDHITLKSHIENINLLALHNYQNKQCPIGGTWERLLAISSLCKLGYVIQLDSDTITLGDMKEVRNAVAEGRSFVIGTVDNQDFEFMPASVDRGRKNLASSKHVQNVAEANFDKLVEYERMKYVRGCSGFSGFAKNSVYQEFIESISSQMYRSIGERWNEWGTEQVTSNIVVSNSEGAVVLPHPKYCNCRRIQEGLTKFVHFIGTCRFSRGIYTRYVSEAIARLNH